MPCHLRAGFLTVIVINKETVSENLCGKEMWVAESNLLLKFKDLCSSNRSPISLANNPGYLRVKSKYYVSFPFTHLTFSIGYWVISTQMLTLIAPNCVRKETFGHFFFFFFAIGQHEEECREPKHLGALPSVLFIRLLPASYSSASTSYSDFSHCGRSEKLLRWSCHSMISSLLSWSLTRFNQPSLTQLQGHF